MAVDAYEEGVIARHENRSLSANPYPRDSNACQDWKGGWYEEDDDIAEAEYDEDDEWLDDYRDED